MVGQRRILMGDIIADAVGGRWDNPTGAYNIALKERLTDISEADNWKEARKEWKATGNVWYIPLKDDATEILPPHHADDHPNECICGHKIAWHFEIENTENKALTIVGSDHIGFWMIVRHLIENKGIPEDMVTEERVKEWITEAVKSMKSEWWWREHGEEFEERFNAVKKLDLIFNTRRGEGYYDDDTDRYERQMLIRKKSEGKFGENGYGMASIVWRWNHTDNEKCQKKTRGWPNQRLENDLLVFFFNLDSYEFKLKVREDERKARIAEVIARREQQEIEREEQRLRNEEANRVRRERQQQEQIEKEERRATALQRTCDEWGIPLFAATDGNNDWERDFLEQMISKIINEYYMSEKQKGRIIKIILGDNAPATNKQLRYIESLSGKPTEGMTKENASKMIDELKERKNNE